MKPVVFIYCEGNDVKLAAVSKEKGNTKIHRVASLTMSRALYGTSKRNIITELESSSPSGEISFDSLENVSSHDSDLDTSDVGLFQSSLYGLNIGSLQFVPMITEPIANYHIYEGPKEANKNKLLQAIITDIQSAKGIDVDVDSIDVTELNDKSLLSVFIEGEIPSVNLINLLANYNKKRYLKIPTVKTAELPLAYYVSKTNKFFPEDNTLIIYIGKEYSKLIFLEGQKLKHIGAALDIGTKNLHTYDVYFSKILLEMENGGIPKLDNIILCGEDRSENLILSFYGTFPEANVTEFKFDGQNTSALSEEDIKNLALYAVPLAVAEEYFDELSKTYQGINFLPKYIQENQKFLQFGWHSYVLLLFAFIATFFLTFQILSSYQKIKEQDYEIERLTQRQIQNQALVDEITPLENRISTFDATQAVLDSAAAGSGIWNKNIMRISDFMERRRNFWITKLESTEKEEIRLNGFALSRSVLTEFAEFNGSSLLKNIYYEPLREKSAFSYNISVKLEQDTLKLK